MYILVVFCVSACDLCIAAWPEHFSKVQCVIFSVAYCVSSRSMIKESQNTNIRTSDDPSCEQCHVYSFIFQFQALRSGSSARWLNQTVQGGFTWLSGWKTSHSTCRKGECAVLASSADSAWWVIRVLGVRYVFLFIQCRIQLASAVRKIGYVNI